MEPQFKNYFANTPFRNSLLWDVFAINKFFDNSLNTEFERFFIAFTLYKAVH